MSEILIYVASGLLIFWGTFHLFPVNNVVKEFGDISKDNKEILRMEWLTEGIALIFTGLLVLLVTLFGNPFSATAGLVYYIVSGFLLALAILSLFTGFKVNFLPYKLCPVIFGTAAVLIILGNVLL
jgi:hypothetical protein